MFSTVAYVLELKTPDHCIPVRDRDEFGVIKVRPAGLFAGRYTNSFTVAGY